MLAFSLVLLAGAALCVAAPGKPESATPADKLAFHFDFETDSDGNNFPDEWVLLAGRRHPQNLRVKLDRTEPFSGERALLVELDGVATVAETAQAYPFDPTLSWRLSGFIKAVDVPSSGPRATSARIEVIGLARDARTVVFSAQTGGVTGTSEWTRVSLDVPRDPDRPVRWIRIRCVVDGVGLAGKVWFDDITFAPRPTLHVVAGEPDGFFSPGHAPRARISFDSLLPARAPGYVLSARLFDPAGAALVSRAVHVAPTPDFLADADLELPFNAFGVYLLEVELTSAGTPVSSLTRSLLYWPGSAGGTGPSPDFGVYAGDLDRLTPRIAALLIESDLGAIALEAASAPGKPDTPQAPAPETLAAFTLLRSRHVQPVVVLGRVDESILNKLYQDNQLPPAGDASWVRVLSLDPKYWTSDLARTVGPFAARTTWWQIGPAHDPGTSPADLARAVRQLRAALAPTSYRPKIGVTLTGAEPDALVMALKGCDFAVLDSPAWPQIEPELAADVSRLRSVVDEVWVTVPVPVPSPGDKPGSDAAELTRRAIRAKIAGADRVMFTPLAAGLLDPTGDPRRTLSAAATLARELGQKPFVGVPGNPPRPLDAARLLHGLFLFLGPSGARLASIPSPDGLADVTFLGKTPRRIDLDGNAKSILTGAGFAVLDNNGRPFFVDGLDVEAMRFKLSPKASR
jgi:hypothetical protein